MYRMDCQKGAVFWLMFLIICFLSKHVYHVAGERAVRSDELEPTSSFIKKDASYCLNNDDVIRVDPTPDDDESQLDRSLGACVDHHVIDVEPEPTSSTEMISATPSLTSGQIIAREYQRQDMGRAVMGYLIPVIIGLFALNNRPSPVVLNLVLISVSVGFTAIWTGILLRETFLPERIANRIEHFGVINVLASFFGLISSYQSPTLAWIPWLCWVFSIAPFALTFSPFRSRRLP